MQRFPFYHCSTSKYESGMEFQDFLRFPLIHTNNSVEKRNDGKFYYVLELMNTLHLI
jgi:hypothetical protein